MHDRIARERPYSSIGQASEQPISVQAQNDGFAPGVCSWGLLAPFASGDRENLATGRRCGPSTVIGPTSVTAPRRFGVAKRVRVKGLAGVVCPDEFPIGQLASEPWLGRQESNLGMAESKSAALPLGYAPTGIAFYA
jgi:hypothetical protein